MQRLLSKFKDKNLLKWGAAAILLAIPLYPKFPLFHIPGTYVAVRLEDFLILGVSFIWLIEMWSKFPEFKKDRINKTILLFLAIGFLSVVSGIFLTQTVIPHIGFLHWLRRLEYFMAFLIGVSAVRSQKDLMFFINCILLLVFSLFVWGVGQKYFNWPIITTQNLEYAKGVALRYTPGAHLPSTFAGHYDLASFLVMVLPLFFSLFYTQGGKRNKIILGLTIFFALWLLINAVSRISIISYLLAASFALFLIKRYKEIVFVFLITLLFVSLSTNLIDRYTRIFNIAIKNLMSTNVSFIAYASQETKIASPKVSVFEDRSTSIRLNVEWPRAFRAFSKNPLLGTGFSSITLATDNEYLRLLGEVGLIGFLAFLLIFARIVGVFLKVFPIPEVLQPGQTYLVSFFASLSGIFLNALFLDIFEASKFAIIFWLLCGLAVSLLKNKSYEPII